MIFNAGLVVEEACRKIRGGVSYVIAGHFDSAGNGSLEVKVARAQLVPRATVDEAPIIDHGVDSSSGWEEG